MKRLNKALGALLSLGLILSGCGGIESSTGPGGKAENLIGDDLPIGETVEVEQGTPKEYRIPIVSDPEGDRTTKIEVTASTDGDDVWLQFEDADGVGTQKQLGSSERTYSFTPRGDELIVSFRNYDAKTASVRVEIKNVHTAKERPVSKGRL